MCCSDNIILFDDKNITVRIIVLSKLGLAAVVMTYYVLAQTGLRTIIVV